VILSDTNPSIHQAQSAPPGLRWLILGFLFAISVVTYVDRVNISVTARQMMPALGLTDQQMGFVFSSFVVGYALFQIPGGWLGDRWGARIVLTLGLLWWSLFTALTAITATSSLADLLGIVGALALVRFLLGVGEAVALPTFNRAVTDWLPPHERGLGIGIAIGGIGVGSAVTPPLTAWIMVNYGWQAAFYLSAGLGVAMAAIWWFTARDCPVDHPLVERNEAISHAEEAPRETLTIPWASLKRTPTVWWLVLSYSCLGYVAYVYLSWFYLYLVNVRGFNILLGGLYAAAPFVAILVSCPLGGWATDRLALRHGITNGRKFVGVTGMVLAAASIALGAAMESPFLAIASLSLGAGWLYFTVGAYWSSTSDLSRAHAGSLSGMMNMGANMGGALSPTVTPWIAGQWGWSASLGIAAAIALLGGILWLRIDPGKGLAQERH
jgi:ACS family glucarate transporter-like MFS transporter